MPRSPDLVHIDTVLPGTWVRYPDDATAGHRGQCALFEGFTDMGRAKLRGLGAHGMRRLSYTGKKWFLIADEEQYKACREAWEYQQCLRRLE